MRPPTPMGLPKRRDWDWLWPLLVLAVVGVGIYLSQRYWPWSEVNLKARIDDHEQRLKALEERR